MMSIWVQYYAVFRERRGLGEDSVETSARTVGELYAELSARHGFTLPAPLVRASVDLSFRPLETELAGGETVVFIPPVAGG